ncbi:Crp/Fnr family transcriptional regulator [Maribellus maritimus]|uniref:Crp/Fnr family transcriptional regulator n=1 Tax=Maribellus maritimus TaxID=2870838 RepID=UPI001EEC41BB|nr:Crp/Fnr family transcriptional regulator [Maribellus maritimus]MCG6188304.1 Crp/Fnr family transcriptional regulator [Maribellus maritimus]
MENFVAIEKFYEKNLERELSIAEKELIQISFRKEIFEKKQLIFGSGETNTRHYFIEKGLLRMYVIDSSGKEFNILFARENQWIGDLATPAETSYFLDAVEKSVVYSVTDENMNKLTNNFASFVRYLKRSYIFQQKRLISILAKTAEENYEDLVNNHAELINRLPQYHISSYLGVTPVFLSKILSKRARKKD